MGSMDKKHDAKSQKNVVLTDKLDGVSCLLVNKNNNATIQTKTEDAVKWATNITRTWYCCEFLKLKTEKNMTRK